MVNPLHYLAIAAHGLLEKLMPTRVPWTLDDEADWLTDFEAEHETLEPAQCGVQHPRVDFAVCTKPVSHEDSHGYAGMFWFEVVGPEHETLEPSLAGAAAIPSHSGAEAKQPPTPAAPHNTSAPGPGLPPDPVRAALQDLHAWFKASYQDARVRRNAAEMNSQTKTWWASRATAFAEVLGVLDRHINPPGDHTGVW